MLGVTPRSGQVLMVQSVLGLVKKMSGETYQTMSIVKMSKFTKKCMAIRTLSDKASGWPYISF